MSEEKIEETTEEMDEELDTEHNLNEIIRVRRDIYGFLSRGFKNPIDETYLRDIEEIVTAFDTLAANLEDQVLKNGAKNLKEFAESIAGKDREELLQELNRQYTSLLRCVGPEHAHPYESVYLSAEHLVMQQPRNEVVEFYARFSMAVAEDFKDPEDHVSAELSFIRKLCDAALADIGNNDMTGALEKLKGQKEFMFGHLLKWVHLLCGDLRKAAKIQFNGGFYEYFADLTMGFIRMDVTFLDGLIEAFDVKMKEEKPPIE